MNDIRGIPMIFSQNNIVQRRNQKFDVQIWTSYLKITKSYVCTKINMLLVSIKNKIEKFKEDVQNTF